MKVLELKETNSAKAILIGSEVYRKSQFGGKHPLSIPRVSAVLDLVRALGICDKEEYKTGPCAKPELLKSFHTADYIANLFTEFEEIHGDRRSEDDKAIVAGVGFFDGQPVAVIGHEKGRETAERVERNFGMPHPSGFRKANRVMKLAEKFSLPLITLIDTPGAYPGVKAEYSGQHEAIASSLELMSDLKTPIINIVIGEGGSGGGFGIGLADTIGMLEYSIYSVASPEACASILWRTAENAEEAADALKLDATNLKKLAIIDTIIKEPTGGAHRNHSETYDNIKKFIKSELERFSKESIDQLNENRYEKFLKIGA